MDHYDRHLDFGGTRAEQAYDKTGCRNLFVAALGSQTQCGN